MEGIDLKTGAGCNLELAKCLGTIDRWYSLKDLVINSEMIVDRFLDIVELDESLERQIAYCLNFLNIPYTTFTYTG